MTYPWMQYANQNNQQPQANPWAQYQPKQYTFYGNTTDIGLAKASGMQGNFIDISSYGQDSILKDLQHAYKTGANPYVLGGAGAVKGISDDLLSQINQNGVNIARIGGKDRYEVQNNLKNMMLQQASQPIDFSGLRTEQATIDDIAKKYGFDYSRDYAKRQAEAEAQAKRNAVEAQKRLNASQKGETMQGIENNVRSANEGLDRSYFQKGLNLAQEQANNGLNAGIAADQNTRLQMAAQAEMAPILRDAALARNSENSRFTNKELDLLAEMGLIDQQAIAREDSIFNDRLQQGFENAQSYTEAERAYNNQFMNAMLQQRGQNLDALNNNQQLQENARQFNDKLAWDKQQWSSLSADQRASNALATQQLEQQKKQFASETEWRKFTYNNMSATEKAQFNRDKAQFGEEMAWRKTELELSQTFQLNMARAQAGMGSYSYGPSSYGTVSPFLGR